MYSLCPYRGACGLNILQDGDDVGFVLVCSIVHSGRGISCYRFATETGSLLSALAQGSPTFNALNNDCPCFLHVIW